MALEEWTLFILEDFFSLNITMFPSPEGIFPFHVFPQGHGRAVEHFLQEAAPLVLLFNIICLGQPKTRTENHMKQGNTWAACLQIILFLLAEELTAAENWAIGGAASCTVLLDGQGGRANFQPRWDRESCELQRVEKVTIKR